MVRFVSELVEGFAESVGAGSSVSAADDLQGGIGGCECSYDEGGDGGDFLLHDPSMDRLLRVSFVSVVGQGMP